MPEEINDVGRLLKLERQRKSETLEMVHEATKIPIDSLKAIEEGYKVRMLSSFYYKNFVRLYAQYLGMDAQKLVALIPSEKTVVNEVVNPKASGSLAKSARKSAGRPAAKTAPAALVGILFSRQVAGVLALIFVFLFLVGACFGVGIMIKRFFNGQTKAREATVKTVTSAKAVPAARLPVKPVTKPVVQEIKPVVKPIPVKVEVPSAVKVEVPPPAKAAPVAVAPKMTDSVVVTVRAKSNSWLVVRLDGNVNFQGVLKKGNSETWTARKVIEISGNDMDLLEFEVNGKTVGRLSRRDVKGKKIRVTSQGLSVEK
jgi:cytoskeleton protein RodZ